MADTETKLCPLSRNGCGYTKRIMEFHRNPNNRDGLSNVCGECINKRHAQQKKESEKAKKKQKSLTDVFYKFIGINPKAAKRATSNVQRKK